ncbi:MAG: ROK family transcriptional regulator [Kiritimatiellia bacterium]|nr:ROK family transcriptional regulator [Kiritimatiellia bacterium]
MPSTRTKVLSHIWNNPGTHRQEIAAHFGLHPNLVSDAVKTLIKERWVVAGEAKQSSAGRSPIALYLDSKNHAVISVSYSPDSMTCGLVNAAGDILRSTVCAHNRSDPDSIVDLAVKQINKLKKGYQGMISGLAIADPGMVDHCKGKVIRSSSFPGWYKVALAEMFNVKTGLETTVVDITHARAMAQYRVLAGRCQNADTMLYVDYTFGIIGFVFLTPGGIWRGEGFAGEVGHVVMDPHGPLCRCGARGCLESQSGCRALECYATTLLEKDVHSVLRKKGRLNAADIFHAAKNGDRLARTIVRDILADLGLCTAILVAMLHPRLLVVGGETENAIAVITDEIRQAIEKRVLSEIASSVAVIEGRPTNPLALLGAGFIMFERVISYNGKKPESRKKEAEDE